MNGKIILFLVAGFLFIKPFKTEAQVNVQDSLALVDYYDSTYRVSPWQFGQEWDLESPVKTWLGIGTRGDRVVSIKLWGGGRGGHIPSSFGNLTALESIEFLDYQIDRPLPASFANLTNLTRIYMHAVFNNVPFSDAFAKVPNLKSLDLEDNYFTTGLPSSMSQMTKLETLNLFQNSLSGSIPADLNTLPSLSFMETSNNKYTFKEIVPFLNEYINSGKTYNFGYAPQNNVEIQIIEGKLTVAVGGNVNDNTYKWFKDSVLVATNEGDSTFSPTQTGKYYAEVTNSVATDLTLYADEMTLNYLLPTSSITTIKSINGTDTTYINDGILRIAALKPIPGGNALNGDVTTTVTIDPMVPAFNSQPYVQRHYDITPSVNEVNAQAIVVLYFTQQEFENYNNYVTANNLKLPLLPTQGVDNGNVRITQFHGNFTGSSQPGNYSGDEVLIIPSVNWNAFNKWWVVTFPVSGFSGFYLSSTNSVLPLTLLNFTGKKDKNAVLLQWQTTAEVNTKQFIVQQNIGGIFSDIGIVPAHSIKGINSYVFSEEHPNAGKNLYRLKMVDINGNYSYSDIITINFSGNNMSFNVYPNPSSSIIYLKIVSEKSQNIKVKITDVLGKSVYQKILSVNAGENSKIINIQNLSAGTYYLNVNQNNGIEKIGFIKE